MIKRKSHEETASTIKVLSNNVYWEFNKFFVKEVKTETEQWRAKFVKERLKTLLFSGDHSIMGSRVPVYLSHKDVRRRKKLANSELRIARIL